MRTKGRAVERSELREFERSDSCGCRRRETRSEAEHRRGGRQEEGGGKEKAGGKGKTGVRRSGLCELGFWDRVCNTRRHSRRLKIQKLTRSVAV